MPSIKSLSPNYKVVNDIKDGDFYFGCIVDLTVCYVNKCKFEKSTKESVDVKKPITFEDIDTDPSYLKLDFVLEKEGELPRRYKEKDESGKVTAEYSLVAIYKVAIKREENKERYRTMITGVGTNKEKFVDGYNNFTKLCLKLGALSEKDLLPENYAKLKPFEDLKVIFIGKNFKFKFVGADNIKEKSKVKSVRELMNGSKVIEKIDIDSIELIPTV